MNIIQHDWSWRHGLSARTATEAIVLHHAAAMTASADDIHHAHLQRDNGTWAGIGYHLYIRKNGEVHAGRPLWASGAHTLNYNSRTVGVCCEGNYDIETVMPAAQLDALREVLAYLKGLYPDAAIKCHRELNATACPGKFFPVGEALQYEGIKESGRMVSAPTEEDETMTRYNTVAELPEWAQGGIQKLIDKGHLKGKGDGALDLTEDMARVLIICGRMQGVL